MKYLSIFLTILFIWIAILLIAILRPKDVNFQIFLLTIVCTIILFLIGFVKK